MRTLNFEHEGSNDWRKPSTIEGQFEVSLCFWNVTSTGVDDPDFFDYYDSPSYHATQIGSVSAFFKTPVAYEDAAIDICSQGYNCTYVVEFVGPGYKCTELASGVGSKAKNLGNAEPPFDIDDVAPTENTTYIAKTLEGEYAKPQMPTGDSGIPDSKPPYPKNLGALRTEPVI